MKKVIFTLLFIVVTANLLAQTAKVDTVVTEKWNGTAWVNDSKIIYTYDANCLATSMLFQDWNSTTSTWVNSLLTTNTYNSNNQVSQALTQSWNTTTSSWD